MSERLPRIPYGVGDFTRIRDEKMAYVEKTRFIADLEEVGQYLFFLRPRRSGKSLMLSTLACYYDQNSADRFEHFFLTLGLGRTPRPRRIATWCFRSTFLRYD